MKFLMDPMVWGWGLLWLGAAYAFYRHRRKGGWILLGLAVGLSALQLANVPARLLAGLEHPYLVGSAKSIEPAEAVVVLGGYAQPFTNSYLKVEFSEPCDRILTGVGLIRAGKGRVLVLGGGGWGDPPLPYEADAVKQFIVAWNLVSVPIESLGANENTHDEAVHAVALARQHGWKKVILVTSAWHMRRAEATFIKAGLDVVPVGCDFQGSMVFAKPRHTFFTPRSESMIRFKLWLEEVLGYWAYRVRGWV